MNKKDLVMLIMAKKTLDYQKDPNPENWRTIKGAHVHIDGEGKIDGGAGGKFNGKGALPRSMFSEPGKGKQTEFAEVTEKKKEIAERAQKEKEAQKAERRKQQAAARKQQKAEQEAKQRKEREGWYWEDKPESKSEVGKKGMSFLKKLSNPNSSFGESAAFTAGEIIKQLKAGKSLAEISKDLHDGVKEYDGPDYEHELIDKIINRAKREDAETTSVISKGEKNFSDLAKTPFKKFEEYKGAPKSPKKKIDPASTEAQAKRQAIADDMMKRPFVKGKVEEASKKLIAEANKDYGGDHETSVMLENVVKGKDGAYITLKIVAKDKTGKSRFPQSHSMTFKVGDLTKEQKKLYFSK